MARVGDFAASRRWHSFPSLEYLAVDVSRNGYYGALRLIKASLKRFYDYCEEARIDLPAQHFSLRYETNVPRGVGMAGSRLLSRRSFAPCASFTVSRFRCRSSRTGY
jgi:glucuronokinase